MRVLWENEKFIQNFSKETAKEETIQDAQVLTEGNSKVYVSETRHEGVNCA
jgi:hypothetical protein